MSKQEKVQVEGVFRGSSLIAESHFPVLFQVPDDDTAVYGPFCGERRRSSYEKVREIRGKKSAKYTYFADCPIA